MKIRISFDAARVTERGEAFVEIECDPHQHPKLPAFVHTYTDKQPEKAKHGYYLVLTETGALKASKYD